MINQANTGISIAETSADNEEMLVFLKTASYVNATAKPSAQYKPNNTPQPVAIPLPPLNSKKIG